MSGIELVKAKSAPPALGNYSHAAVWRDLVFVAGMASRDPKTDEIPGLVMKDGKRVSYDVRQETRGTLLNIERVLHEAGSALDQVLEVSVYLLDMKDFGAYNEVYSEFFSKHHPARTTVAVSGLPGNIAIEMKVVAVRRT